MRTQRNQRVSRFSRSRRKTGSSSGGGSGLALVRQTINPGTGVTQAFTTGGSEGSVENGNTIFSVGSLRVGSGTATATMGMQTTGPTTDLEAIFLASVRYDTGGSSDGAVAAGRMNITEVEVYTGGDWLYVINGASVGVEMLGTYDTAVLLASAGQEGAETNPAVASVPNGGDYDALLVIVGCGGSSGPATTQDDSSNYTSSVDMVHSAHHSVVSGRQSDSFIGVAPASEDGITITMTTKGFASGGWIMRVFGLTQL